MRARLQATHRCVEHRTVAATTASWSRRGSLAAALAPGVVAPPRPARGCRGRGGACGCYDRGCGGRRVRRPRARRAACDGAALERQRERLLQLVIDLCDVSVEFAERRRRPEGRDGVGLACTLPLPSSAAPRSRTSACCTCMITTAMRSAATGAPSTPSQHSSQPRS